MKYFVGLDVSNKDTSICILDENNNIVKEAKAPSDPESIHQYLSKTKLAFNKIGIEAGALSHNLVLGLRHYQYNAICIDSRAMAAIISVNPNKTDRNDARAIARAMKNDNYREVHIKTNEAIRLNSLLTARKALVKESVRLKNTIRGMLKTYGIKLPKILSGNSYQNTVKAVLEGDYFNPNKYSPSVNTLAFEALLGCLKKIDEQLALLEEKMATEGKNDEVVKRLMTVPGVGIVTAMTYKAEIDDPTRFKKSRSVGAYFGMTPSQYSSGESIKQGRVSKNGSSEVRALLMEAGIVHVTRCKKSSKLKDWGLKKKKKMGTRKTGMAVGRKIAVIMHSMWIKGRDFDPQVDSLSLEESEIETIMQVKKEEAQVKEAGKKAYKTKKKAVKRQKLSQAV